MARLEDIVPPRELCELIPEDQFLDAAFAWHYTDVTGFVCRTSGCEQVSGKEWQLVPSNARRIIRTRERGELIFPAPTLEEIIKDLQKGCCKGVRAELDPCGWEVKVYNYDRESLEWRTDPRATIAALTLWLKLKGVDNEG